MKEYRLKFPCHAFENMKDIREQAEQEIVQKLRDKGIVINYLRSSTLFDPMRFECIVKVEVF